MKFYMHTINGRPAGFGDNQICFANSGRGWKAPLVASLAEIRRQQVKTFKFREANNFTLDKSDYNYVIVEVTSPSVHNTKVTE